jgi:hypothetical protein
MRAAIRIELNEPGEELVDRFRNFGEDVYRGLRDRCSVDIDEIDRATRSFVVRDIGRQEIGSAVALIEREIRRHGFEGAVSLVRVDRGES